MRPLYGAGEGALLAAGDGNLLEPGDHVKDSLVLWESHVARGLGLDRRAARRAAAEEVTVVRHALVSPPRAAEFNTERPGAAGKAFNRQAAGGSLSLPLGFFSRPDSTLCSAEVTEAPLSRAAAGGSGSDEKTRLMGSSELGA